MVKAQFVRLTAKAGKADEVVSFLRDGRDAVMEEPGTTTWYAVRFGDHDFAIFDTFPGNAARLAHLAGKVGRALIARTPELLDGVPKIEHAQVLAYKLPCDSGQALVVRDPQGVQRRSRRGKRRSGRGAADGCRKRTDLRSFPAWP